MRPRPLPRALAVLAIAAVLLTTDPPAAAAEAGAPDAPILEAAFETARATTYPYDRAKGLLAVADAMARAGLTERARQAIDEAVASALESPDPDDLLAQASTACVRSGLHDDAKAIADRMADPARAERMLLAIAAAEMRAGRRSEALQTLQSARQRLADVKQPDSAARAWLGLARAYHDAGEADQAEAAFEQAVSISDTVTMGLQRDVLLEELALACIQIGRAERAVETACKIAEPAVRVSALVEVASSAKQRGDEEPAARAIGLAEQHAEAIGDSYGRARMLAVVADAWTDMGQRGRAISALAAGEAAARDVSDPEHASRAMSDVATSCMGAADLDAACRLIRDIPDRMRRSQVATQLSAQHSTEGRYQEALRILDVAETRYIAFAGKGRIQAIAEAYYRVWGSRASRSDMEGLQPDELRDAVLARYADSLAAEGHYEEAIARAGGIGNAVSRDDGLMSVARRCLDDADSVESAAPASNVLDLLRSGADRLRLRARLAAKQAAAGRSEDAARALRDLVADLEREPTAALRSELFCEAAVTFYRLDLRAEAQDAAAKAMKSALEVGCAGCRAEVIEELFAHLSGPDFVELAFAAAEPLELPRIRAENFVHMAEIGGDIGDQNREKLLRGALQASTEVAVPSTRVALLLRVASGYRQAGLEVTDAERGMLRDSYELAARRPPAETGPPQRADLPVHLVYFDRPGCPECDDASDALDKLRSSFPNLDVVSLDLDASEQATLLNEAICEALSVPKQQRLVAPSVFSAKGGLVGSDITDGSLDELARDARGWPSPLVLFGGRERQAQARLARAYEDLGLLVVISAGLLDGVNPCAFTVIIFFLSYLAYMGRRRREIAAVGIIFTAAVFVTYFAIGMGLAGLLSVAEAWSTAFRKILYGTTAVLVLAAALLSLRDAVRCLRGQTADLTLSLPESLRSKIRLTISKRARLGLTVLATAVLGAVVALFEFPCTGQVYLPVIVFGLHHLPQFVWGPVGWLLVYNLCFILPLVAIFIAVLFGLTSERLTSFFRRHIAATKFAMAGLFAALFAFMAAFLV